MKERKIVYSIRIEPSIIKKFYKLADKKAKTLPNGLKVTKGAHDLIRKVLKKYLDKY